MGEGGGQEAAVPVPGSHKFFSFQYLIAQSSVSIELCSSKIEINCIFKGAPLAGGVRKWVSSGLTTLDENDACAKGIFTNPNQTEHGKAAINKCKQSSVHLKHL